MYLIDTHTHIYLSEFDDDRAVTMERAREAGVQAFYLPAIDSSTHEKMLEVEAEFDGCKAMMGLHPCSVTPDYLKEITQVKDYLAKRKFIAIGEIGLDFYWDKTFVQQQYEAFHMQCRLALQYDLPVVIHSRNAVDECIDVVAQHAGLKGVFHCFSGDAFQARKIMDLGFMLGIGGVLTFKNSGLDKVMEQVGTGAVILETDAPYLAPVPYRGKRNEPAYTRLVAEKLATISGSTVEEIAELTSRNAGNLFKL
ncbi:MAG: TatD family hydrolase [Flavisolibacter sp.]